MSLPKQIDAQSLNILQSYGFSAIPFESLQKRLKDGAFGADANIVQGTLTPPQQGDLAPVPKLGSQKRTQLHQLGMDALTNTSVGVVILAGGMATRFGGVVKAAVPVFDEQSFLAVKLRNIHRIAEQTQTTIPVYLMASFATKDALQSLSQDQKHPLVPVQVFAQYVSLRLLPNGDLFRDNNGKVSLYAPGHGDLNIALRASGILKAFRNHGGTTLFVSNVDNLTATLDPALIGMHLKSGAAMSAEMAPKHKGDKGGAPACVDGKLQIVETFRFPNDFDQDRIPVFNTNTMYFNAEAIDLDFPLDWFCVRKKVDGQEVVQFERLAGQLSAFLPTQFIQVDREGNDARFQPIKTPNDLPTQVPTIQQALKTRNAI